MKMSDLKAAFLIVPVVTNPEMRDDAMKKLAAVVKDVPTLPLLEFVD